jgi:hypothetical protein
MAAVDIGVDALAVHRLTKFVIDDEIFADLREKITDRYPPESTKIGYLVGCPWCVSVYMGTAAVVARALFPKQWTMLSRALAFSSVTGMVYESL